MGYLYLIFPSPVQGGGKNYLRAGCVGYEATACTVFGTLLTKSTQARLQIKKLVIKAISRQISVISENYIFN